MAPALRMTHALKVELKSFFLENSSQRLSDDRKTGFALYKSKLICNNDSNPVCLQNRVQKFGTAIQQFL